jgi:hypothetical protein
MVRLALAPSTGSRQPTAGPDEQPVRHSPATGALPLAQLVHSVALGPLQVTHAASHGAQPVSLVVVQAALSYWPAGHVAVQASHVVLPGVPANVPAAQARHVPLPVDGW